MTMSNIDKNYEYVKKNWDTLLSLYFNKYIIVVDEKVVGTYDSYEKAASVGIKKYGYEGKFLVHHIAPEKPMNIVLPACYD